MIHSSFNNCLASCYKRCLYFCPWLFCCQLLLCTLDKAHEDGKQSGSIFFFFLKYVETAAGFLGLVCTRQEGAAENQVTSNAVQPLQCVYGTHAGPEAVCVLSAVPKCCCTLLAFVPILPLWLDWNCSPTYPDFCLAYFFTHDHTTLGFAGTWFLSLHHPKLHFASLCAVV